MKFEKIFTYTKLHKKRNENDENTNFLIKKDKKL